MLTPEEDSRKSSAYYQMSPPAFLCHNCLNLVPNGTLVYVRFDWGDNGPQMFVAHCPQCQAVARGCMVILPHKEDAA